MSFLIYDIVFLILFATFLFVFLHSGKKNLKREGLLILYKAAWGIKLIDYIGKRFKRTFKVLSYVSVITGYILMATMFYFLGKIVYIYITMPSLVKAIKVPPIMPLVPYIDKVVPNLGLPSFYFTYFIVIIAIIAISHEFAHGIFAAHNKVKVKSTGFGFFPFFLPIFLAAFVELDEKVMAKKKKFSQLAILSAGTFANLLTAILFFGVLLIFFSLAFTPSGIIFNEFAYAPVAISTISSVNGISIENPNFEEFVSSLNKTGSNKVEAEGTKYIGVGFSTNNNEYVKLYHDAPAINANLERIILKVNGVKIKSIDDLQKELLKYSPGEKISLNVLGNDGSDYNKDIVLGENPKDKNLPWLGIGFSNQVRPGIIGKAYSTLAFKDPYVYYKPSFGASEFIYYLLWWTILISISVALINMLPVGIFDGGRFFYLTVLGITKSEKMAKNLFAFSTYFILFLLFLLMSFWVISFF